MGVLAVGWAHSRAAVLLRQVSIPCQGGLPWRNVSACMMGWPGDGGSSLHRAR